METIFDYDPTPEELQYLAGGDAQTYHVSNDAALADLAMLFAMRGAADRADIYVRQISDPDLRFDFLYEDLIPAKRAEKRAASTTDNESKAA